MATNEVKKTAARKPAGKEKTTRKKAKEPRVIIQSPMGGEITVYTILARVGDVDTVYIRTDMNKAYWVKGTETGSIDLW